MVLVLRLLFSNAELNNLGLLEIRELMRYWPVAMIGLGVYMLYARMKGGNDEPK